MNATMSIAGSMVKSSTSSDLNNLIPNNGREIPPPVNVEYVHNEDDEKISGIKENLMAVLRLSVTKRMLVLMPEILWCGISIAYYSGMLVLIMSDSLEEVGDDDPQ
jgi:hypothetical protein